MSKKTKCCGAGTCHGDNAKYKNDNLCYAKMGEWNNVRKASDDAEVWRERYLKSLGEIIDENARWVERVKKIEEVYKSQMDRLVDDLEQQMQEGYNEAWNLLQATKQQSQEREKALLAQIEQLKAGRNELTL